MYRSCSEVNVFVQFNMYVTMYTYIQHLSVLRLVLVSVLYSVLLHISSRYLQLHCTFLLLLKLCRNIGLPLINFKPLPARQV